MISITLGRGGVGSRQIIAVIYRGGPANNNNNVPVSLQDFFPRLRAHSALSSVLFSIYLFLKKGQFLDILTENRP